MFDRGDIIDSKYEVLDEIGRGGMGVVLRVRAMSSSNEIALKYCALTDHDSLRRFSREVRFMAGINHAHIMQVLDQNLAYSPPYFTMPIAVRSLATEITSGLSEENALEAFRQICLGCRQFTMRAALTEISNQKMRYECRTGR